MLIHFLLLCSLYLLTISGFLFSPDLPIVDSYKFHFPAFKYIGDALAHGHFFPEWFPVSGGVRTGFTHISLFSAVPHRILGYCLYACLPISAVFAYKLQIVLGMLFVCFGWWLVLKKISGSAYSASFGTLAVLLGGTGITFHQEQVLATIYLIPWFVFSLLKIPEKPIYFVAAAVIFGLGLSTHQPQIQLITMGLIALTAILRYPAPARDLFKRYRTKYAMFHLPVFILIILAAAPSIYLYKNMPALGTQLRAESDDFSANNYELYRRMNLEQKSSARPAYFTEYLTPTFRWASDPDVGPDPSSFFAGRIALLFALFGIIFNRSQSLPIFLLGAVFAFLTLGVNSPISFPRLLFLLHFPFIALFRQWFHFFPMINSCISALAALGFAAAIRYFQKKPRGLAIPVMTFLFVLQIADLALFSRKYLSLFRTPVPPPELYYSFAAKENVPLARIFQYRNRIRLADSSPETIPNQPFLTNRILSKEITATNIPDEILAAASFSKKAKFQEVKTYGISPEGLLLNIVTVEPTLLVTPLNFDLGLKAFANQKEVSVWRINGALAGILLSPGEHKIEFKVTADIYRFLICVQLLLFAFLTFFFLRA